MSLHLRPEQPSDINAISELTREAFLNAPHTSHTEQFIVNALRRSGQLTLSLVALEHGQLAGHIALSPVTLSCGTPGWYGIGPLSVRPDCQQRGIGSQLVRQALPMLQQQTGASGCVLLGDPAYYSRFGFVPDTGLTLPGIPPGYFQALSFGPPVPCATVSFHAAFDARA
ncbi:N-acetyltransferase [Laribacter hongkongensis]|uniref:GNAT family N-acetyltransferase n=1 Tax=Laribacter hongkongensis TaxID=168471 RepID=UPI001EFCDBF4|nr:N-acetyltransferase [Laribacter hongkongensis]MCG8996031.1 N-acetyltransferase [Laribacter hongkongensis]MCG9011265.1 N-acetyltransferase [Laribacter hongkongensis]MCG9023395.1 N-acetyltransferase [Laribacter hongkongensis]MCG9047622.1 N-acetyltransferase [Laribacter hongkongensis]MCG9074196.1 N-acetyltransferase [Laribacter hongkongensis]